MFMTTRQIADNLSVSLNTVKSLIEKGKLRAFRIGKQYRVRKDDYQKFLIENYITVDNKEEDTEKEEEEGKIYTLDSRDITEEFPKFRK